MLLLSGMFYWFTTLGFNYKVNLLHLGFRVFKVAQHTLLCRVVVVILCLCKQLRLSRVSVLFPPKLRSYFPGLRRTSMQPSHVLAQAVSPALPRCGIDAPHSSRAPEPKPSRERPLETASNYCSLLTHCT